MSIKRLLYDIAVIGAIAICTLPIALWSSVVAFYYTIVSLPGELLHLADRVYNENL